MLIDRVIVGSMFTNCYIVSTGKKECMIVDPGAEGETIVARLEAMNLIPQAIVYTHGHIDHTSASQRIREHFRTRGIEIPIGIHQSDTGLLGATGSDANRRIFEHFGEAGVSAFEAHEEALPDAEFYYGEGDALLDSDLLVMHTPGHSAGSTCFYSEARGVVFSGDTLFFNTIGRGDLPEGDADAITAAVEGRLFELPSETRVFPGHGPLTTIEREIRNNPMVSDGATI